MFMYRSTLYRDMYIQMIDVYTLIPNWYRHLITLLGVIYQITYDMWTLIYFL